MKGLAYLKDVVTLSLNQEKCTGCGVCLSVCPRDVLIHSHGKVEISSRDACMECGACQRNCPHGALFVKQGVGCASAVINQMLGRKSACCTIEEGCDTTSQCC